MTEELADRRSLIRRLYDWCVAVAGRREAFWSWARGLVRRKLFLPDPARRDADPDGAGAAGSCVLYLAAWCSITSVAGGILGYAIGALLS